jgi:hypothetical protein
MLEIGAFMEPGRLLSPAETALSLLFKKLHPLLEDAAHQLAIGASAAEFEKLHSKLQAARGKVVDILDGFAETGGEDELHEILDTLSANLTPMGESLQQSLVLTQLCLEEAPKDLLRFAPAGSAADSSWGRRMVAFLQRLEDPAFQAKERWQAVDPDLGDEDPEGV